MNRQKLSSIYLMIVMGVGLMAVMTGCGSDSFDTSTTVLSATPTPSAIPTVIPSATPTVVADANLMIDDPLTNGRTVGQAHGGEWIIGQGYKVTYAKGQYLSYATNIIGSIRVEFDVQGLSAQAVEKAFLIEIFDTPQEASWNGVSSAWTTNNRFEVMKPDGRIRFKAGGKGQWELGIGGNEKYVGPLEWNSYTTYHWVFSISNGYCQVMRNGQILVATSSAFQPIARLNIRIGGTWEEVYSGIPNAIYANVKVYRQ